MAHPRQSGMTDTRPGVPQPVYQQSVFSVPRKQHSVVPTIPVPSTNFVTPQILYPGALPSSFRPVVPFSATGVSYVTPQMSMANLQSGAMFSYPYVSPMNMGVQNISKKSDPAQDAQAIIEDKKKFDKERQFQLQQQKLKQFGNSGAATKLSSDTLIENMFGKTEKAVRTPSYVSAPTPVISPRPVQQVAEPKPIEKLQTAVEIAPVVNKIKNNKKNLDHMMQQCSNLTGPPKAKTFQKPAVRDLKAAEQLVLSAQSAFSSSQKSRDWTCTQGLQDVFMLPRSRFPAWCSAEWVPPLYKQIEQFVTGNGQHEIETNQLYSVLLLSGLPREVLGHIWNLVNTTTPGQLMQEELYAALALIALVQSGCPVSSTDILHSLPRPPIPALSCQQVPQEPTVLNSSSNISSNNLKQIVNGVEDNLISTASNDGTTADDDFGDFCSVATASAANVSSQLQTQSVDIDNNGDEFEEFQQATVASNESERIAFKTQNAGFSQHSFGINSRPDHSVQKDTVPQFSMTNAHLQTDDRYAVFRELGRESGSNDNPISNDDFGDFLCADATDVPPMKDEVDGFGIAQFIPVNEDFADFGSFQSVQTSTPEITAVLMQDNVQSCDDICDDFGDFASSQKTCDSLTVSRGFQKDNISFGETHSICSLDLGLYAGEGLRRQGSITSIPSLDLRPSALDDGENGNSDEVTTISPVLQKTSPASAEEDNSPGIPTLIKAEFPTGATLIDKYSFIRHETETFVMEDKLCFEWLKCLSSCDKLLQNASQIFEQMGNNQVTAEVLDTEEGQDYVKNVIEIYRVAERIHHSVVAVGKKNEDLCKVLASIKQAWTHLTSFLIKTSIMPGHGFLDFSTTAQKSEREAELASCGVCLLAVDSQNNLDQAKLTYGGRQYHSTCANLWVNCVDLLLPALPMPHLL